MAITHKTSYLWRNRDICGCIYAVDSRAVYVGMRLIDSLPNSLMCLPHAHNHSLSIPPTSPQSTHNIARKQLILLRHHSHPMRYLDLYDFIELIPACIKIKHMSVMYIYVMCLPSDAVFEALDIIILFQLGEKRENPMHTITAEGRAYDCGKINRVKGGIPTEEKPAGATEGTGKTGGERTAVQGRIPAEIDGERERTANGRATGGGLSKLDKEICQEMKGVSPRKYKEGPDRRRRGRLLCFAFAIIKEPCGDMPVLAGKIKERTAKTEDEARRRTAKRDGLTPPVPPGADISGRGVIFPNMPVPLAKRPIRLTHCLSSCLGPQSNYQLAA